VEDVSSSEEDVLQNQILCVDQKFIGSLQKPSQGNNNRILLIVNIVKFVIVKWTSPQTFK